MKGLSILLLTMTLSLPAIAQTSGHRVADAIGGNKIIGDLPKGYEDFLALWVDYNVPKDYHLSSVDAYRSLLVPDKEGKIAVGGRVVFKGKASRYLSYEYKSALLVEKPGESIKLIFDTEVVEGVSYHFEGTYLERKKDSFAGHSLHLEGVMTRLVNGQRVAENKLRFLPYAILE
jgi:hypothetical protein